MPKIYILYKSQTKLLTAFIKLHTDNIVIENRLISSRF